MEWSPDSVETEFAYEWSEAQIYLDRANGDRRQAFKNLMLVLSVLQDPLHRRMLSRVGVLMYEAWSLGEWRAADGYLAQFGSHKAAHQAVLDALGRLKPNESMARTRLLNVGMWMLANWPGLRPDKRAVASDSRASGEAQAPGDTSSAVDPGRKSA